MTSKLINNNGTKTFAVVFRDGDEVVEQLSKFAGKNKLNASQFTGIGAFSEVTLGFFDFAQKDYNRNEIKEQVELLSLVGDITRYNNEHKIHAHVVVGKSNGAAFGGHLLKAIVHPTVELIITESHAFLERQMDEATGLPLIKIEK